MSGLVDVLDALAAAKRAEYGDSNDAAIEAWRDLAEVACGHLGISFDDVPDPADMDQS